MDGTSFLHDAQSNEHFNDNCLVGGWLELDCIGGGIWLKLVLSQRNMDMLHWLESLAKGMNGEETVCA